MEERYHYLYAAAAVRGNLTRLGKASMLAPELYKKNLYELSRNECERILEVGLACGVKLYHFKKSDRTLPRVNKVIGFLKSIYFESLLDVGSGRGVFLLPFLDEFAAPTVTAVDILEKRIELMSDIRCGGVERLSVVRADICTSPFEENSFDVVTMLEVLEHIPDVRSAVRAALRAARKYVVVTVPSKEDSNPEHIHLLTKDKLTALFTEAGAARLRFEGVPGHLFMIASVGE